MKTPDYAYICEHCGKAVNVIIRAYRNGALLAISSGIPIQIDPFSTYREQVLAMPEKAGVYTTPLLQFYGYFDLKNGCRIVVGPSGMLADDPKLLTELMFLLDVPADQQEFYKQYLRSVPPIRLDRLISLIQFFAYSLEGVKLSSEMIVLPKCSPQFELPPDGAEASLDDSGDAANNESAEQSFAYETMLLAFIQNGEPERVSEWVAHMPNTIRAGFVAHDALRQMKNIGICVAAISARAAIAGGLNHRAALQLSDVYIQQMELVDDSGAFFDIYRIMLVEYASRVRRAKMGLAARTPLLDRCARYVSANITAPIRVESMAHAFGMGRSYLCTRFREESGVTLTEFIRREKILEAQRLLEHTRRSLPDIAHYLSYCSQSHFQNAFKRFSGVTPGEYRRTCNVRVSRQ